MVNEIKIFSGLEHVATLKDTDKIMVGVGKDGTLGYAQVSQLRSSGGSDSNTIDICIVPAVLMALFMGNNNPEGIRTFTHEQVLVAFGNSEANLALLTIAAVNPNSRIVQSLDDNMCFDDTCKGTNDTVVMLSGIFANMFLMLTIDNMGLTATCKIPIATTSASGLSNLKQSSQLEARITSTSKSSTAKNS